MPYYRLRQIVPESKFSHDVQLDVFEQIIPPALIAEVLTECDAWEQRERELNMPAVISVIIAMGLLPILSIPHVLSKVAQGLRYVWPDPSIRLPGASALSHRRQQLGVRPMQVLFQRVCRPRATKETPGAFAFGLRLMAIDSTLEDVPDTFANELTFGRGASQHGPAPYPQVRGVYLQECGTHLIVDAIFGSCHNEPQAGFALLRSIQRGMLVLLDRGLHNALLIQLLRAMGAHVLGRLASNVIPQYARRLCDGTYLAYIYPQGASSKHRGTPLLVRVLEYSIDDPKRVGHGQTHRLVTTLLNPRTVPAEKLIELYHERWEIELSIDEIDTHQRLLQRTLRSQTPEGVLQELYGLLLAYYAVRALMLQSAQQADLDVDRLSFTHAITLVTTAMAEVQQTEPVQHPLLYERLLADLRTPLLPARRPRSNPRVVKHKSSKFPRKGPHHRPVPKLEKLFHQVIVLLKHSGRYQRPQRMKGLHSRLQRVLLLYQRPQHSRGLHPRHAKAHSP